MKKFFSSQGIIFTEKKCQFSPRIPTENHDAERGSFLVTIAGFFHFFIKVEIMEVPKHYISEKDAEDFVDETKDERDEAAVATILETGRLESS